jgi:hypothetical protein
MTPSMVRVSSMTPPRERVQPCARDLSIAMDPLAWNMSFASTAIFIAFKNVQTLLNIFTWFKIWLAFTVFLTLALFYGAIRYWMYIYFGDFPCFRGGLHNNMLGFCADGMVLVGGACHKLNAVDPYLESAWFQPLEPERDLLVSKCACKWVNLCRYTSG